VFSPVVDTLENPRVIATASFGGNALVVDHDAKR
jgi:hypothetical protein